MSLHGDVMKIRCWDNKPNSLARGTNQMNKIINQFRYIIS